MADPIAPEHGNTQESTEFLYPILPVQLGEFSSNNRSTTMTSVHIEQPSSLSRSWSNLSTVDFHSDNDSCSEETDVVSLVDKSVPDDVISLSGQDDGSESDTDLQSQFSDNNIPPFFLGEKIVQGSQATATLETGQIEFEEPDSWPETGVIELKHTIHDFDETETPELLCDLPDNLLRQNLSITIRQTMTKNELDNNRPYHILYVGHPAFKQIILDKLGDVLVSGGSGRIGPGSSDSSRFHVVPTSFGLPNSAELLPIHLQLVVDECVSVTVKEEINKPDTLELNFKNREPCKSVCINQNYEIISSDSWTLPDVAIFFVAENDSNRSTWTRELSHHVMERHRVPTIVISERPFYRTTVQSDRNFLHTCVEYSDPANGEVLVLQRYPIDLMTFEKISAGQLNRSLASFPVLRCSEIPHDEPERLGSEHRDLKELIKENITGCQRKFFGLSIMRMVMIAFVFLGVIMGLFLSLKMPFLPIAHILTHSTGFSSDDQRNISLSPSVASHLTVSKAIAPPVTTNKGVLFQECVSDDPLLMERYIAEICSSASREKNLSKAFWFQRICECHVMLRLPSVLASKRDAPKVNIEVSRSDKPLRFSMIRFFDGVYSLRIPKDEAYGRVMVIATTQTEPAFRMAEEIDFGTAWSKVARWTRAARGLSSQVRKDLTVAHAGISEVSLRMFTDLRAAGDTFCEEMDAPCRVSRQAYRATLDMMMRSKEATDKFRGVAERQVLVSSDSVQQKLDTFSKDVRNAMSNMRDIVQQSVRLAHERSLEFRQFPTIAHSLRRSRCMALAQRRAGQLSRKLKQIRIFTS